MKFQHIIESVYFQPWSITDAGWRDINRIVKPHILGSELPNHVKDYIQEHKKAMSEDSNSPEHDFFGNQIEKMQITPDGLAVIPVFGPLINHASLLDKMCGACSYQQIQSDLSEAVGTPGIKQIAIKICSPGGMCNGMAETCRCIIHAREAGIKTVALSDRLIGSAAYGLACCCDSISITETTMVGSIGSFCAILDASKAYEMAGLKMEVIKSGELKGAGVDGTSLTPEQRDQYQKSADFYGEQFRKIVRECRMIDEKLMQGQVFIGDEACQNGFADMIIEDISCGFSIFGDEDE